MATEEHRQEFTRVFVAVRADMRRLVARLDPYDRAADGAPEGAFDTEVTALLGSLVSVPAEHAPRVVAAVLSPAFGDSFNEEGVAAAAAEAWLIVAPLRALY